MLTRILTACVLIPLLVLILIFSWTLAYPVAWAILSSMPTVGFAMPRSILDKSD